MKEQEPHQQVIPQNWRYPAIPEDKIRAEAITYVAQQTGLTETWVQRIHDFQWQLAYDCVVEGKTVLLPKLFRILIKGKNLQQSVDKLEQKKQKLLLIREKKKQQKKEVITKAAKEKCRKSIAQIDLEIETIDRDIKDWTLMIKTKTKSPQCRNYGTT